LRAARNVQAWSRARRESHRQAAVAGPPESAPSGASRGGRERASVRPGAGKEGRARGQGWNSLQRRASPDRAGLAARQGEGRPQDRCRSRSDVSESPGAASDRPRGGELALGEAPRAGTRLQRRPQRPSPRGARRSRPPFLADVRVRRARRGPTSIRVSRGWELGQSRAWRTRRPRSSASGRAANLWVRHPRSLR
jgi:hypothetical protein